MNCKDTSLRTYTYNKEAFSTPEPNACNIFLFPFLFTFFFFFYKSNHVMQLAFAKRNYMIQNTLIKSMI